jgi:archaeal chaperonin
MTERQPVYILPENVSRTIGREAQRNNILAVKIIAEVLKTTLGPKGMDKMLVDSTGGIIVTNDGVTILEEMEIDHPAAKMIVDIAKTQESEVGDGTTTVALLAGKLLENAEKLLDKRIHPTVIVKGYKIAAEKAKEALKNVSKSVENENILAQIAMTAMTGKGAEGQRRKFSELIIKAVNQISTGNNFNIENIKIEKLKGDSIENSELIKGIVLNKEPANEAMPKKINNAKILLIDFPLEIKGPETETKISISTHQQLQEFIESEERTLKEMTEKIINSKANVVFCQKGIDDVAQYYLSRAGIFACRRVAKSDLEKISKATSARIMSNIKDIKEEDFGFAETVEEEKHNEDSMTYIKGCKNPKAVTILIRGSTEHILDEIERAIKDGLGDVSAALKDGKVVPGGGAIEIELSKIIKDFARTLEGREQLAVEEFANALESIPEALAENAGLDPINVLTELKQKHESGNLNDGLNLFTNKVENCFESGIVEPSRVKLQAINSATEVASMILRIDDVLVSSGSSSKPTNPYPID